MKGMRVTVYDKNYRKQGEINDYETCSVEFLPCGNAAGQIVVDAGRNPVALRMMRANTEVVPITVQVGDRRWSGRVNEADQVQDGFSDTITATLDSDYQYLHYILAWPNNAAPLLAQFPSHDVKIWATESIVKDYIQENADRLGAPVAVAPKPVPDPSAIITLSARMNAVDELIEPALKIANLGLSVTLWLPGDPQPTWTTLSRPTYVVDVIHPANKPFVVWDESLGHLDKGSVASKSQLGSTVIAGGKSNSWLDDTFPALPKDIFLAFDSLTNTNAKNTAGPYAYPEVFTSCGSGAVTIEAREAALKKQAEVAGRRSVDATVTDLAPWRFGPDYNEGDVAYLRVDGELIQQTVTKVTATDTRDAGLRIVPTIGDTRSHEDPLVELYARFKQVLADVNSLFLGG